MVVGERPRVATPVQGREIVSPTFVPGSKQRISLRHYTAKRRRISLCIHRCNVAAADPPPSFPGHPSSSGDNNNCTSGGTSWDSGTGRVLMPSSLNLAVREAVPASLVLEKASPIALAKALKNEQELQARRKDASV